MSIIAIRCKTHNRGERRRPFHLFQIAYDEQGKRVRRALTEANDEIVKGAWEYTARPFDAGLYCKHCLDEGNRIALPIDNEDLIDIGLADVPLVFQSSSEFSSDALVTSLYDKFANQIRDVRELPARPAVYADDAIVDRLHPGVQRALDGSLLPKGGSLYAFQANAISAALDGYDTIVTTPTASGKSLTYTVPIVDTLLRDRSATALYISPLVALTEDQLEVVSRIDQSGVDWNKKGERFSIHRFCRTLDTGHGKLTVARYDGSVPDGDRQDIRQQQPQYLLTTADMLHMAILNGAFNERQWYYFLSGLRYVVIDELHTYRGVLGAAFANLLRRLRRLCQMLGANPQFLCASATLVDPAQTVERFIGREPVVIDAADTGAPQNKRQFVLWNSEAADGAIYALSTQAKNVLLHMLNERVRGISFARSISEINDIYRFTSAELREIGITEAIISPFMRELLPDQKRTIVSDLKQGRLHGVIATSALSMGIDIGSLSVAVIIGFPGSIAQLWQQAGRAGRSGEGVVVLIADHNPLDQFFAQHPDVLFDLSAEPVYCNPDNPYIVRSHLLQAAKEAPLREQDIVQFGPTAPAIVQDLVATDLLQDNGLGQLVLAEEATKFANEPFRNLAFSVPVRTSDQKLIVTLDATRAQRYLHKHAHYQHIDQYYRVVRSSLDWQNLHGEVIVQPLEHPEFTTTPRVEQSVALIERRDAQQYVSYWAEYGNVQCSTSVSGYYRVPLFVRNEPFEFQPLGRAAPAPLEYLTQACWLTFHPDYLAAYPLAEQQAALYSLAGAIRLATAIEELCDPSDIEALGFTSHPDTDCPTLILYDTVLGGIGIAEAAYKHLDTILYRAEQILADCRYCSVHPESRGCPYCVTAQYGDEQTISRHLALELLAILRG